MKNKICVLLTTYNPNEYLDEQINSIFNQKNIEIELIIRDDGSSKKEFLHRYKNDKRITILEGERNLGVAGNILELLKFIRNYKQEYDYFAYSDQDDVWFPDKLEKMYAGLSSLNNEQPSVYYSNLLVTNAELIPSHELFKRNVVNNTLGQALSQVFLFACTSGFNYKMIDEVVKYDFSKLGFDSLLYYIGVLLENIYYDEDPHIYYRQHGNNVSGQKGKGFKYLCGHARNVLLTDDTAVFKFNANYVLNNLSQYCNTYDVNILEEVANYQSFSDKIKLLRSKEIKAGYQPKDIYRMLRILIGKY